MHPCPICGKPTPGAPESRYPRALCAECMGEAVDAGGRAVQFFNVSVSGGLMVRFVGEGALFEADSFECFVRGVRCLATEARMGGIVIQPVL